MWELTIKRYYRHYEGDNRYVIETAYCYDTQIGKWLSNPKTWDRELLNYRKIR